MCFPLPVLAHLNARSPYDGECSSEVIYSLDVIYECSNILRLCQALDITIKQV